MKLARHLEQVHASEPEVAMALAYPKSSKERRAKFADILKRGDFVYNTKVIRAQSGFIIARKRPTKTVDSSQYLPCSVCYGMYLRKDLWRHAKYCCPINTNKSNSNHQALGRLLLPTCLDVSENLKTKILNNMLNDKITAIVMGDPLILAFGERLLIKVGANTHQYNYVKQKLRELARLLQSLKSSNSVITSLQDCIDPVKFKDVIAAVRNLCGGDDDGNYLIPSLALKIGHSLKKCALLLKSKALQGNNELLKQKAESFLDLYASDWDIEISSASLRTIHERLFNKPKRIPLAEDLKLFCDYLEKKASFLRSCLCDSPAPDVEIWKELNEVTLAQIVLFNRRRGGESERITVSNYTEGIANSSETQEEVFAGLSSFEKKLVSTLDRIEIRGKRGRKVAVLLTSRHKENIMCLLQHRSAVGVNPENNFLFARCCGSLSSIRSCDVLRKFAAACGAKQPSLLTSTSLRKHVATISQILNLKDNELDCLADFLGHDIRIHREFYRLPESTIQLAKVSKLLVELEHGDISKYSGKSLDEIHMDYNDEFNLHEMDHAGQDEEEDEEEIDPEPENSSVLGKGSNGSGLMPSQPKSVMKPNRAKKTSTKKGWKAEEKAAVERQLGKFFTLSRLPGKFECQEAIQKEPALRNRPWSQIKFFIKNCKVSQRNKLDRS